MGTSCPAAVESPCRGINGDLGIALFFTKEVSCTIGIGVANVKFGLLVLVKRKENKMSRKRTSFAEQAVMPYMEKGETYKEAKARLDRLWEQGEHPAQKNNAKPQRNYQ